MTKETALYEQKMKRNLKGNEQKKTEEELYLAAKVFENAMDEIVITDSKAVIQKVNRAFTEITGYSKEEVIGKNTRILKSGKQDTEFYTKMWDSIITSGKWEGNLWNRKKDGSIYPEWKIIIAVKDENNKTTHYISMARDMSERVKYEEQIKHQAYHDILTGLPTRLLFYDRLSIAIANAQRVKQRIAVIFLDIDGFKFVNDNFGHNVGDILLQSIAKRLMKGIRKGDTIGRLGGDEFIFILPQITGEEVINMIALRLLNILKEPFLINEHTFQITGSMGISHYPDDGDDIETLLKKADIAMYQAKEKGKNNYQFYYEQATD
ncbi:MAG: diguanylate cyclase [Nitrospinota bacterium]